MLVQPLSVPRRKVNTTLMSGTQIKFNQADFTNLAPQACPVVLAYNKFSHYCPTVPTSPQEFTKWRLANVVQLCKAQLVCINEMVAEHLPEFQQEQLLLLQDELQQSVTLFTPGLTEPQLQAARDAVAARKVKQKSSKVIGPLYAQAPPDPADFIRSESNLPGREQAPGQPSSSNPDAAGVPEKRRETTGQKGRQHQCNLCPASFDRPSKLIQHKSSVHKIGAPIECNRAPCVKKTFSSYGSLNQHIKTVHEKKYTHWCEEHKFGTMQTAPWNSHIYRFHKDRLTEEQKAETFICEKCKKPFNGPEELRVHMKKVNCGDPKNFFCPYHERGDKFFTTKLGRDNHIRKYHPEKLGPSQTSLPLLECQVCHKQLGDAQALERHMSDHRVKEYHQKQKQAAATQGTSGTSGTSVKPLAQSTPKKRAQPVHAEISGEKPKQKPRQEEKGEEQEEDVVDITLDTDEDEEGACGGQA